MESNPVTRRLAAIVIADVVGYTRLMERDDTGTFARLRTIRDEVVDPAIVSHGGRVVKTAGDGLLAEFPSALAALRVSVQIQGEMAKRNTGVAADERIDYRIGVNLGDIMIDGNDIAGDGVNVASRLESLAEPGGICVSGSVREQVHGQLAVAFVDIGEQQVKNIERPIRVYRVVLKGVAEGLPRTVPMFSLSRRWWRWGAAVLAAGVLAMVGLLIYTRVNVPASTAPPMSIAILPFSSVSRDAASEALAARLTQDVITMLERGKRSAQVTPYSLVSGYKGNTVDPRVVGHSLGVRYVADGELHKSASGLAVTTRLYEADSAVPLSVDTAEVAEPQTPGQEDLLGARAAQKIRSALFEAELSRSRKTSENSTLDLLARSAALLQAENWSLSAVRDALKLVDEALKRDPNNVAALVRKFWYLNGEYEEDLHADRERIVRQMDEVTSRAVLLDPSDAEAWHARAITFAWQGRWDEAEEMLRKAREIDPANPRYIQQQGFLKYVEGRPAEALALVEQTMQKSGLRGEGEMRFLCWFNVALGRYATALQTCPGASAYSGWWSDDMFLAAAYAQAGQLDKARETVARLRQAKPDITIELLRQRRYSSHPDYRRFEEDELFAGLRKAGVPEK